MVREKNSERVYVYVCVYACVCVCVCVHACVCAQSYQMLKYLLKIYEISLGISYTLGCSLESVSIKYSSSSPQSLWNPDFSLSTPDLASTPPWASQVVPVVKNPLATQEMRETWVRSLDWEDPRRRAWQPTPVFLSGESHGQRSLVGYRPQVCRESDMTEQHMH